MGQLTSVHRRVDCLLLDSFQNYDLASSSDKGPYGLTEAPRLWYLRAGERLTGPVGLTELRCLRAMLGKHHAEGDPDPARGRWILV